MEEFCNATMPPLNQLFSRPPTIDVNASLLMDVCLEFRTEAKYNQPMVFVGYYIAVASICCSDAMLFDLVFGIASKKFWFPTNVFSLNAITITVMAVVIKLPMDLSSPMPDLEDQGAKIGSLVFMCTMMSHLMPSLRSTNNVSNVSALSLLVITLIVNVCIQLNTGVISNEYFLKMIAGIYMGMLFFLLLILISSSIAIPSITETLESKYEGNLTDQIAHRNLTSTLEELRPLVKRYWIMAQTGSPQFVIASSPLSFASGMICAISMAMHLFLPFRLGILKVERRCTSAYSCSTLGILIAQTFGVVISSIAPIVRSLLILKVRWLANKNKNHSLASKVDRYWTKKANDIDSIWDMRTMYRTGILFYKVTSKLCQIIEHIPITVFSFAKCISCRFKSLEARLSTPPAALSSDNTNEDLGKYVLLVEDDVPLTRYMLKRSLAYFDRITHAAAKTQFNSLPKLLEKSSSFDGVVTFDTDQIQPLLPFEYVTSWSLPIISLTCIAITIPGIDDDAVDNLFKSVREGILCTHTVEERLNRESVHVNVLKATIPLWHEVVNKKKWLGNTLRRRAYEGKTSTEIIKFFAHKSKEIVDEFKRSMNGGHVEKENLPMKLIAADSMYRITQTIMHTYESNNLEINEDELFTRLSVMIADILAACLTNIPRVILQKCNETTIDKREDSVRNAIYFLERTSKIIKVLETRELPNMDKDKMAYIDEWRLHLRQP